MHMRIRGIVFFFGLMLVTVGIGMPDEGPARADGAKAALPRLVQGLVYIVLGNEWGKAGTIGLGALFTLAALVSWFWSRLRGQ